MAKYTTEVRSICEIKAGLSEEKGYNDVNTIVKLAAPKIFDFSFPVFDENYRLVLETKILKHYYTREIAFETVGLWKLKLDTKLNEIMPYYNKLYNSALIEYNPLWDTDLTRTFEGEKHSKGETNSNSENTYTDSSETGVEDSRSNMEAYSDTPQGALTNVENLSYLSAATKNDASGESTTTFERTSGGTNEASGTSAIDDTNSYVEHLVGTNGGGTYAHKIIEYRKTLLNIDMMIIDDLKDLFFMLW